MRALQVKEMWPACVISEGALAKALKGLGTNKWRLGAWNAWSIFPSELAILVLNVLYRGFHRINV